MDFYAEKFKRIRELKRISMQKTANRADINRSTLWAWEKGKRTPSEANIRILAKVLNIDVREISNLEPLKEKLFHDFSKPVQSLLKIADLDEIKRTEAIDKFRQQIELLSDDLNNASTIINALLSSLDVAFYIKDTSQRYIMGNSAFLRLLKLNVKTETLGKEDQFFFAAKEAVQNSKQDIEVMKKGLSLNDIETYIPGTRKKRLGLISKKPIFDSTKNIIGLIGVFIDITERVKIKKEMIEKIAENKIAEKALIESEKRFRDISSSLSGWLWEVNEKSIFTYCSENASQILGYSSDEIIGKTPFDFMHQNNVKQLEKKFKEMQKMKKPIINLENWNICKNGKKICILTNGTPFFDSKGNLKGYRGVDREITREKELEEQLKKLQNGSLSDLRPKPHQ